jgi:hypothetical protein
MKIIVKLDIKLNLIWNRIHLDKYDGKIIKALQKILIINITTLRKTYCDHKTLMSIIFLKTNNGCKTLQGIINKRLSNNQN